MSNRNYSIYIKNEKGNVQRKVLKKKNFINQKKKIVRRKRGTKRKGSKRSKPQISRWNMVKNRLSNISNMKNNRKLFLNTIENRNTTIYRKIKRSVLSKLKINLKKKYLIDFDFDEIKIISKPTNSASNSIVYLLRKDTKQYILKITGMKKFMGDYSPADTEKRIYSIMNLLVDRNITPHVFTLTYSSNKEIPIKNINRELTTEINSIFDNSKIKYIYPMITETANSTKMITTFNEFILKKLITLDRSLIINIFFIILFQIMYTLEVFNIVGLKHNDLHLKNIFVQINSKNIINSNQDEYYNKYIIHDKEYLIPNIGIDIRIFDFDRSCKSKNGIYNEFGYIESNYMSELYSLNINCQTNPSFDTFKVLGEVNYISNKHQNLNPLKQIVNLFFTSKGKEILENDIYIDPDTGILYKDLVHKSHRYYLINRELPNTLMTETKDICHYIGTMIQSNIRDLSDVEIFQEFSTHNI